ncbi:MAG: glycerol kinase [Gammaproteobacteria bacterium RIFCSPHIGHO2_12_FULL_45_12]|nr:MAG: glycerol kinase [Gammaproteobacteria bacterium RIFCSPHIGHO2_12_FULL_45_12]
MSAYLLAIDQGTTNSRAIIFNQQGQAVSQHELPLQPSFPNPGWVEQNANDMFHHSLACCTRAIQQLNISPSAILGIGLSNQRETTIIWDKKTGEPIYPAIVWQDRRTSEFCKRLSTPRTVIDIQQKTGLIIDPYFSASKIIWLLDHVAGARQKAERGELLFGTVDTFLIWKFTQGKSHVTDASNASRTLLFNLHTQTWDQDILSQLNIPASLLPTVLDNAADFGKTAAHFLGASIPIAGVAGDQQAATIGQACFQPGMIKATYGTGGFILLNTGHEITHSNRLVSTIAYRLKQQVTFGIEGSIFSAGATIKWLRDTLQLIHSTSELAAMAASIPNTAGVYLVPAFTGLGAPYWDPEARGAILGLTRNSDRKHIVRAGMESVCYQTRDLIETMTRKHTDAIKILRVDGGMAVNDWLLQFLADMLDIEVQRPVCIETSALGAAYLAGLQTGIYQSLEEIAQLWKVEKSFIPNMKNTIRADYYAGWKNAVHKVLT